MANVNVGAVLLTGMVVLGGSLIGGISRLINGGSFIEITGGLPWFRSGNKKNKREFRWLLKQFLDLFKHLTEDSGDSENSWWKILDQIDKALLKYDFDTTACTQRVICWHVKDSLANIEENKASTIDHVISGLTR